VGASASLLHSCLTYAPQLREADRADFEHALAVVIDRTSQLDDFMRRFADVYRLPAPRRQRHDLRRIVEGVAGLVRVQCEQRRIEWRMRLPGGPVPVHVDRPQLEQALLNVAKNAIEALGHDGCVTVRLRPEGGRHVLEIEDTGPGLSEAARANLFTPFFSTKEQGQGLGLTLVQEVLSNHGIAFSLDGPPGGPTTFAMWIGAA
jgi:signal transduction histidine kinase